MGERGDGIEEIKKKRGRPKKNGSLYDRLNIRMDHEIMGELRELSRYYGITQADIVRGALRKELELMRDRGDFGEYFGEFEEGMDDFYEDFGVGMDEE